MRQQTCGANSNQGRRSLQGHASRTGRGELQTVAELQRIVPPATSSLISPACPGPDCLLLDDEEFLALPIAAVRGTGKARTQQQPARPGGPSWRTTQAFWTVGTEIVFWEPRISNHMRRLSQLRGQLYQVVPVWVAVLFCCSCVLGWSTESLA